MSQQLLAQAMRQVAQAQQEKVEALLQMAEAVKVMEPEQFEATVGSEWTAPGWAAQIVGYVEAATTARPAQTFEFHHALAKTLATAQRHAGRLED